ncbi:hypothetical protein EGW08_007073 [Elysia chlorotica]|uniref:BLOC-2 complex member HPS6 N-terminal domain-containing protein n=1 Tax=Elysia chlorotica TaxID=188477 RepID=A0A433TUE8_ELYCH|nr:hypothetical protein EGW08_007073 [Elysia chlorotica]
MEVFLKEATVCMPLFRNELFHDVVCKKAYGNVSSIWHFPGHIVITTNEGRKLFTFDCIPVALQQTFDQKFLDIPNLQSPLLDCLMLAEDIISLVDKQGHIQIWKFTEKCIWVPWGELDLCQSNSAEVVSVNYVRSIHQLVWCERRQSPASSSVSLSIPPQPQYCVCRRQLPPSFIFSKVSSLGPSSILLHNVLRCNIHAISQEALFISLMHDKSKVSVFMIFDFTEDVMTLYVGDKFITAEINDGIDFQEATLMCLSSLARMEPDQGDCGIRADEVEGQAVVLNSNGAVDIFAFSKYNVKKQLNKRTVQLEKCDIDSASAGQTFWFVHKQILGIVSGNVISLYSLRDGTKLGAVHLDDEFCAVRVIPSASPVFLAWILTPDQLYGLNGKDLSTKEVLSMPDKLPNDELLQTDILRLARLQERKSEGYSLALSEELQKLKEKWSSLGGLHQQSEVAQILAPHVEEYWRLEDLSKVLLEPDKQLLKRSSEDSSKAMVSALIDARTISRSGNHAKLLWLSQVYPQQLLECLLQGITFQNDTVDQNQLRQWQSLLGLDGGDLLQFEFVCRLLFHLEPAKLLQFAKCAELVSEQAVGVSAFVRKKHSLIYYKAACECLPDCQTSTDPRVAAISKAKLILATECDNCKEKALKCYLSHGLWSEAVELLREVDRMNKAERAGSKSPRLEVRESHLPALLHITMTSLAQNQVLSKYVTDLFDLMPNWKSFLSFSKVTTGRSEIRQQQLSSSTHDVFAAGDSAGIPLESVKSSLLDLVKRMDVK